LGGALPPVDRLPPKSPLRHGNTELDLFLRVVTYIGRERRYAQCREQDDQDGQTEH